MHHKVKIHLANAPNTASTVVNCRRISIRERLLTRLLGRREKVMILVPGDSVDSVDIAEVMEGGEADGNA